MRAPNNHDDRPMNSTYELIAASAAHQPEQVALRFLMRASPDAPVFSWRYRQLLQQITRFANWLHAAGVGKDDAVSIVLPNLPQFHFAFWGAQAAGIANPINPMLDAEHMASIMRTVGTKVLVTMGPQAGDGLWDKMAVVARDLPALRHILTIDLAQFEDEPGTAALSVPSCVPPGAPLSAPTGQPMAVHGMPTVGDFDAALGGQQGDTLASARQFSGADIAAYFHTGGTTGIPKVARHSHANEVAMASLLAGALDIDGGKFLCGLPLFHVNGITVTGLLPFMLGGSVLLLTAAGYRGAGVFPNFWKIVERHGINYFSGVPTVYASLLEVPIGDADVSSLRYGVCGAAPLSPETMRRFEDRTGIRLLEGYGLTEGSCASTLNPVQGQRRSGSIGKAIPGIDVKAVQLGDDGAWLSDCADDVVGQLVIRGPTVFPGYLDDAANQGLFLPGGWLKTGDLGRRDADGFVWLAGRAKDLIIRGGHNIDPATIEEALLRHPSVALAAAVGRPDRHAGELPVAYIQCRPGHSVTVEALMAHAAACIAERAALPKAITVLEAMPLTAVGKVFKPALVWREAEAVLGEALAEVEGVASATVAVGIDARRGMLATVTVSAAAGWSEPALAAAVQRVLGGFALHIDVRFTPHA